MNSKDKLVEFKLPTYRGRNIFIKTLLNNSLLRYYGVDNSDYTNFILPNKEKVYDIVGGIKIKIIDTVEKKVLLYLITVDAKYRKQKAGSTIMNWLVDVSNKTGYTIILTPSSIYNTSLTGSHLFDKLGTMADNKSHKIPVKDLFKWYSIFGFKPDGKDEDGKKQMKYTPPEPQE